MNNLKKLICLCLAFTLSAVLLGCGGGGAGNGSGKKNNGKSGTASKAVEEKFPEVDLDGYEFVVLDCTRYGDYALPAEGTNEMADAVWENIREVEERLNCKITYKFYDPVGNFDTIYPTIMSGEKLGDVIYTTVFSFGPYINADALVDLNTVPGLNVGASYWNPTVTKGLTIGGRSLGVAGDIHYYGQKVSGMLYNRELIRQLGLEDPYDLVKKDQWTFEKFREMCQKAVKDLNGDSKMTDVDRYGLVGPNFVGPLFHSSGQKVINQDKNGLIKFTGGTGAAITSLNFLRNLIQKDNVYYRLEAGVNWMKWFDMFSAGQALFNGCAVMDAMYTRDMEDEKGFVVNPKGPDTKEWAASIENNANFIGILKSNPDLDKTGPVLEALGYLSHRIGTAYQNDLYEVYLDGDEKSIEMHQLAMKHQVLDLVGLNVSPTAAYIVHEAVTGAEEPGQLIPSRADGIQSELDNAFNTRR